MSVDGTFTHPQAENPTGCFTMEDIGGQRFSASGSSYRTWARTHLNFGNCDRLIPSSFYIAFCIKYI